MRIVNRYGKNRPDADPDDDQSLLFGVWGNRVPLWSIWANITYFCGQYGIVEYHYN